MTARPRTATAFSALTSTATLAHVEKAHRKLARQPHSRPLKRRSRGEMIAGAISQGVAGATFKGLR